TSRSATATSGRRRGAPGATSGPRCTRISSTRRPVAETVTLSRQPGPSYGGSRSNARLRGRTMAESFGTRKVKVPLRLVAALAASLLVAGCGTRLSDARIEAAAGVGGGGGGGPAAATGSAAPAATGGSTASGVTGAGPAAASSGGSAASPAAGVAAGAGPAARSASGSAGTPAAAQARGSAGSSAGAASAGGSAAPGTPAPGAGAAPVPGAPDAAKAPVVIGNVGDYSGIIGTLMKGGNVMAQVVARYVNDHGGLDGHPMQVVTGDAGGDPARALSIVRDMVENKGAVALMGNLWVFSGTGPRGYLEEHKIPVIGGDGTMRVWDQSPM